MWDLIVSVPDHCLSFYFTFVYAASSIDVHMLVLFFQKVLYEK